MKWKPEKKTCTIHFDGPVPKTKGGWMQMKKLVAALLTLSLLCVCCPALMEREQPQNLSTLTAPYGFKLGAPLSFSQLRDKNYLTRLSISIPSPPPTK